MQSILNRTAMANNVAPQFLEYLDFQDERHTVGQVLYHFTIMDPAHHRYKSTVAFKSKTDAMSDHEEDANRQKSSFDKHSDRANTERELLCTIFPNDDETITMTVFEAGKTASLLLNEASIRQLIELLNIYSSATDPDQRRQR